MPNKKPEGGSWKAGGGSRMGGGVSKSKPMSRIKKVAKSPAAKDLKKVAKVAVPGAVAAAALKKANDATNKDLKRMKELRKKYNQSPARTNMTFNDYVKRYGK